MHDTRGRVRIEKTPEGDGNCCTALTCSLCDRVRIEKTPEGDGNGIPGHAIFCKKCKNRENSGRRRKHFVVHKATFN